MRLQQAMRSHAPDAVFEIVCGSLIALGLLTRFAVIPTITIMLVAIFTTKIPILQENGFWEMAHASRTDFSMLLGSIFLLCVGAGRISLDTLVIKRWGGACPAAGSGRRSSRIARETGAY